MPRMLKVLMWIITVPKLTSLQDLLHFRMTFYDRKKTYNKQIMKSHQQQVQALQCAGPNTAKRFRWNKARKTVRLQYTGGTGSKITR